jgi:hypothetical protein
VPSRDAGNPSGSRDAGSPGSRDEGSPGGSNESDASDPGAGLDAGEPARDAGRDAEVTPRDASQDAARDAAQDAASPRDASTEPDGADGPVLEPYTLIVDAPVSGATLKTSPVIVRGRAPGFQNVEVWDAQHQSPPLGRVTPNASGAFQLSIDIATLASGATTWTVHAWDSAPGTSFSHSAELDLSLTLDTGVKPPDPPGGGPSGGTPDPGTKYVPAGYSLKFSDEFRASTLDTAKWNTLAPFGVHFFADSQQKQYFVPEAVTLADDVVRFTARKSNGNSGGQPYTSGSITTNGTFTRGYFESRVKVPAGKGYWPAYWLTSSTRWPPEWDIFEIIDNVIFGYTHPVQGGKCSFVDGAAGADSTYQIANLYGTWHVYGFLWTASDLYWYVDGVTTEHYSVNAAAGANDPMWLNLSLQVGGSWPGDPNASTPFPGVMEVDYVRVYQQ